MKTQGKSDGGGASAFTVEEKWANFAAGLSQTLVSFQSLLNALSRSRARRGGRSPGCFI